MVVYTMGPVRSRPFTMAVHSVIGIGFLAGTFLVKPFLPEENSSRYKPPYFQGEQKYFRFLIQVMCFDFHVFFSDSIDDACGAQNKTTTISTTTDAKVNSNTLTQGKIL